MVVATDYELFGTSDLSGGGHVTWTLTGDKAHDLRTKIIHMFDEYTQIPRGFPFAHAATNANGNGSLESAEGVRYTDLLENVLETPGGATGTLAQYLVMYPFDLRDKNDANPSLGFERSTSGLANTNLNTTSDVVIRFLFQANTTTRDSRVPLSTIALAQSLYEVFSFEAVQSPNMTASGPYPGSWPFQLEGGWHVVPAPDGRAAFWAGNLTTGRYDNSTTDVSRTNVDPPFAVSSPMYIPFDLRLASKGWITFNYTGQVSDVGDRLRLQIARAPTFSTWTDLSLGAGVDLPATPVGTWSNMTVDLRSYLGDRVRLRLNFTSDGSGNGPGFFLRDFAVHAPAYYTGEVVESDTHYLIGTLSFSDPAFSSGGMHLIRTPGGEIMSYSSTWNASGLSDDTIRFRTFDVTENPQILFGVMLVASYAISRLQESSYDSFRETHPAVYRPAVRRAKWLHRGGKIAIAVLILFYFVPTALWVVGLRIFVSGPAYWFLALTLSLVLGFGARAYYRQKLEETPPPVVGEEAIVQIMPSQVPAESPPPVETQASVAHCSRCLREVHEGDKVYDCSCGAVYHLSCATGLMRCANCRKPIAVDAVREKKQVSMRCEACGELATVREGADPRAITCPNCGGRLRHLDEGKRYLIVASHPAIAFAWMRDLAKGGKPSLCMTPASPDRLRLEFGVKNVQIVQVSSHAAGATDPRKLDPTGLRAILPLAREGKGGVILYDALDQMISESSIGDVIRFLRKANDMAFVHAVTVIARVSPGRLAEAELRRLRAEFDEYVDLTASL